MTYRQTRIFVPPQAPFDTLAWVETLVGSVILPVTEAQANLNWFWFSRYTANVTDSGDCDIQLIPPNFAIGPEGIYRSLRFRYSIPDESTAAFEDQVGALIEHLGCRVSDFRNYQYLDDLAWERFLGGEYTPARRAQRADRMAAFLTATSRLFIDALEGPDDQGYFRLEHNAEQNNNPHGSTFESIHHLFCNITEPPLHVLVAEPVVGTRIYQRAEIKEVAVRF